MASEANNFANALRQDAWFAGFVDGEGCFFITPAGDRRGSLPGLSINVRADDAEILRSVHRVFGGSLVLRRRDGRRAPQYQWQATGKASLRMLLEYFEAFPLRAKKRRDCAIWCEAVRIYLAHTGRHPDLPVLKQTLEAGRVYDESAEIAPLRAVAGGN